MLIRLLQNFFRLEYRQRNPIFPHNTQICLFNKRLTLHRDFSQKTLQDAIDDLQGRLHAKGYLLNLSGKFDSETEQAVREFQKDNHLFIDGVVGPLTWACLCYPKLSCSNFKDISPDIKAAVKKLQVILREEGFLIKDTDGCFGKDTEKAVKIFQSRYGLRIDGIVGAISWAVLLGMRQRVERRSPQGFYPLVPQSLFIFDQLLMIFFIVLGMYLHPTSAQVPPQFSNAVATAYALTYVVPVLLEKIPLKPPDQSNVPLLKYAPFICVGMFWNTIFELLEGLIEKLLLAI
jgi:peptidoglycan hydrolase-like protein with peptidoglycan-binding domain